MGVLTQETIAKIEEWEGVVLYAYDDATGKAVEPGDKVHGTLTIGVGHVGPDVKPGLTITRAQADVLLQRDLQRFDQAVGQRIGLHDHRREHAVDEARAVVEPDEEAIPGEVQARAGVDDVGGQEDPARAGPPAGRERRPCALRAQCTQPSPP